MTTPKNVASGKPKRYFKTQLCLSHVVSESPPLEMHLFGLSLFAIWNSSIENSETGPHSSDAHRGGLWIAKRLRRTPKRTWKNYNTQERKSVILCFPSCNCRCLLPLRVTPNLCFWVTPSPRDLSSCRYPYSPHPTHSPLDPCPTRSSVSAHKLYSVISCLKTPKPSQQ